MTVGNWIGLGLAALVLGVIALMLRGRKQVRIWNERGWRMQRVGRDELNYEELIEGVWLGLELDGELLTGPADFAIRFASLEKWAEYPAWAQGRRDEIIARIKQDCPAPRYRFEGE